MKSIISLLAVSACLVIALSSCEKQSVKIDSERSFSTPFKSIINENNVVKDEQSTLLILVKNISDHRCFNHLVCDDPGEATVRVEVSNMNNSSTETMLHLGTINGETKIADSVNVEVDGELYMVHLTNVSPHPFETTPSEKSAELVLKKK